MTLRFTWNSNLLTKRVLFTLVICAFFILVADLSLNYYRLLDIGPIKRFFNITREDGIANFFSAFVLVANGVTLFLLYWFTKVAQKSKKVVYGWLALALFFTFMGIDDATKFHERVGSTAKILLAGGDSQQAQPSQQIQSSETSVTAPDNATDDASVFEKFQSYPWQVIFGPFFGAMGLFVLYFLWSQLPGKHSRILFVSALTFYVVAVGLDYIEGLGTSPYERVTIMLGEKSPAKVVHLGKAVEETLENLGHIFFLVCYLSHLQSLLKSANVIELKAE